MIRSYQSSETWHPQLEHDQREEWEDEDENRGQCRWRGSEQNLTLTGKCGWKFSSVKKAPRTTCSQTVINKLYCTPKCKQVVFNLQGTDEKCFIIHVYVLYAGKWFNVVSWVALRPTAKKGGRQTGGSIKFLCSSSCWCWVIIANVGICLNIWGLVLTLKWGKLQEGKFWILEPNLVRSRFSSMTLRSISVSSLLKGQKCCFFHFPILIIRAA